MIIKKMMCDIRNIAQRHVEVAKELYSSFYWSLESILVVGFMTLLNVAVVWSAYLMAWCFNRLTGNVPLAILITIAVISLLYWAIVRWSNSDDD